MICLWVDARRGVWRVACGHATWRLHLRARHACALCVFRNRLRAHSAYDHGRRNARLSRARAVEIELIGTRYRAN